MNEKNGFSISGYIMIVVLPVLSFVLGSNVVSGGIHSNQFSGISLLLTILVGLMYPGFFMVQPKQARVLTLFGSYVGTVKETGLRWTIPLFMRRNISLRIRNFESGQLKVNDNQGNPIEIATVIVWSVNDTAQAVFEVDDYESYVSIQSEAALRNLATSYPYDIYEEGSISLRGDPQVISDALTIEVQNRLENAGMVVHEARISHLAYAPEIAHAMLQRQQATAIIAAREKIVQGAVGMVDLALEQLSAKNIVELDEERKAAMVSNLLVVLCGDQNAQPIVNAGSLY
ncbi:SPFH domain-containing protein [Psychrosphaera sp. B3R10]|uniref:SPFH domain-containing protein n=1 Tax=unclassified Psychrosphaera TaxID=2641570 RepID=UPI001C08A3E1|nr:MULTISPECIES: SPFH domain-containing protein [unclassified Psychrosphaera]MBU2883912.1 SPFH domain-containing protein [Psychrosphaera sp. I2R16]MBU2991571.1 SPFH domain-containing protein [Psychrosphaera sp. B3R10]